MLERVQERSWLHALGLQDRTHLRGAQKALAQWAIVAAALPFAKI